MDHSPQAIWIISALHVSCYPCAILVAAHSLISFSFWTTRARTNDIPVRTLVNSLLFKEYLISNMKEENVTYFSLVCFTFELIVLIIYHQRQTKRLLQLLSGNYHVSFDL